jgi:hypothetical protein
MVKITTGIIPNARKTARITTGIMPDARKMVKITTAITINAGVKDFYGEKVLQT